MKKISVFLLLLVAFVSCNTQPDMADLVRYMVVQTRYDVESVTGTSNIFTTYSSFVIREDTIGLVSNTTRDTVLVDGVNINVPGGYVKPVISEVKKNLASAGYQQVDENGNPSFAVNIVVLQNLSVSQFVSAPPFYPGGYFGYYGYYRPFVSTYYANYATLVIEIVDIANFATNGNRYKVIWNAAIGDLISTDDLRGKSLTAINQAFVQSPYIKKSL
ncbi:MAG: DUF4136 domain-containing protein [Cyclobacteriaceae bacterium]|nr:DUF4136 domain-containing protein [Cyclobacteriaceae bacterium]